MSKFKVGDTVRRIMDTHMGMRVGDSSTVTLLTGYDHVHLAHFEGAHNERCLSLCADVAEPPSPIRTVTRREIVPGKYGNLTVYLVNSDLRIEFLTSKHTAEELREAAHILNQIAEALEDG